MTDFMNTREVADYLRLKERKIYELVAQGQIPCTRITGKWLFPRHLIDLWILQHTENRPSAPPAPPPLVLAGSHDPLLEWAVRESGAGLALLFNGSLDGLQQITANQARLAGLHILDVGSGAYNVAAITELLGHHPVVAVEWAWRVQGLITAANNPLGVTDLADLASRSLRFVGRQREAGSYVLLQHLLQIQGVASDALHSLATPALSETEVALAVQEGRADAGLGIESVARQFRLGFVPLHRERYDLVILRHCYFEESCQALLAFANGERFQAKARELGGYEIGGLGTVHYNSPV